MKKLNVGSGKDVKKGFVNLDIHNTYKPEVIFDLNDIHKGRKLPFDDDTFDYVLCAHVLEDFIEPMPIIEELIRVCKSKGEIEIRTPSETNIWSGNPYHKRPFSLKIFRELPNRIHYGKNFDIEVKELKYYTHQNGNFILRAYKNFFILLYNLLGESIVENTPIEYLMRLKDVKVIYKKK